MIYLDHNATTPLDAQVLEAMLPYLQEGFGNPSSVHRLGRLARGALDQAREQVAALVGVTPSQVIFTSGGTEANNLALKGAAGRREPGTLLLSSVEHPSVRRPAEALARRGWRLQQLPVDGDGILQGGLPETARLASVMLANNETGVVHRLDALAEAAERTGAWLHTDAVQAAGKLPLSFAQSGAHMMSLSAHKIYGPKGVGALIVDKRIELEPLVDGGGQEKGRRGGTENLAGIVGFGAAAELAAAALAERCDELRRLRDRFEAGLGEAVPEAVIFGQAASRLPNTSFFAVPGIEGETLLMELDRQGVAVSSGSACSSGSTEPSPVLQAMGVARELAKGAVRVSFGKDNSESEVDSVLNVLRQIQQRMRTAAAVAW